MRLAALIVLLSAALLAQSSPGERIYKSKCAPCHSVDGSAASPLGKRLGLRDLRSAEIQNRSDGDLAEIIGKGRRNMPAFQRQLSSTQMSELIRYVRTLPKVNSLETAKPSQTR